MAAKNADSELSEAEIERSVNDAIRRALNTPPTPAKELIGKSERAIAQRESRVRKATRSKPKNPSASRDLA
jgi:hypothetical protein